MKGILTRDDIKPLLKWATSSTKKLVYAGIDRDCKNFPQLLFDYNYFGTLDCSMAAIILSVFVWCNKGGNILQTALDYTDPVQQFGKEALTKGTDSHKLLEYLEAGDGKNVKNYMDPFCKMLETLMVNVGFSEYVNPFKKEEVFTTHAQVHDRRVKHIKKVIEAFKKQAGKITPWRGDRQQRISGVLDKFWDRKKSNTKNKEK
ncbi:MAG: hypothetical protein IJJ04_02770 [Clostridia bacterium]|nr:hypothetical protein [Clostridia bacterium]